MMNITASRRLLSVLFATCLALVAVHGTESIAWRQVYETAPGNTGDQAVYAGATDASGNIYAGGALSSVFYPMDCNPGAGTDSKDLNGGSAAFVTRVNADGSYAWTYLFNLSAGGQSAKVRALQLDGSSLYVAGWFNGTLQDQAGNILATSLGYDVFVARLTVGAGSATLDTTFGPVGNNGIVTLGGMGDQGFVTIAGVGTVDKIRLVLGNTGELYLATAFTSSLLFLNGAMIPTVANATAPGADVAVVKLSTSVSPAIADWTKTFGGSGDEYDPLIRWRSNELYCAVTTTSTDAKWTDDASAIPHIAGGDVAISKLDTTGIKVSSWAGGNGGQVWGGTGLERVHNLMLDNAGSIYLIGEMQSPDGHWYLDANLVTNLGAANGFVLKLNNDGTVASGFGLNGMLRFGGTGSDNLDGGIVMIGATQLVVTGTFTSASPTLTGGAVNATIPVTSRGGVDNLVLCLEAATGVPATTFAGTGYRQWGSAGDERTITAVTDHSDASGVVLLMRTDGSGAGFGPSGGTLGANPGVDSMVCRLDGVGAVKTGFGTDGLPLRREGPGSIHITRTVMAPDGSMYVGGVYAGTVDLDPTGGTATFTCANPYQDRLFVSRFSAAGAHLWTRDWGSDARVDITTLKALAGGGVVAVGWFSGANAGWAGTGSNASAGKEDVVILKLDAGGTPDNAFGGDGVVCLGGADDDVINGVEQDASGRLVATGHFRSVFLRVDGAGTLINNVNSTLAPTLLTLRLTTAGILDSAFNGTGAVQWGGTTGFAWSHAVTIDASGRIIVAGSTSGQVGFAGANSLTTAAGAEWGILLRLTAAGALDTGFNTNGWVVWGSPNANDWTLFQSIYATASNDLVVGGCFTGTGNGFGGSGSRNAAGASTDVVVLRVLEAGAADTGFNGGLGSCTISGSGDDGSDQVVVRPGPAGTIDCTFSYASADGDLTTLGIPSAGSVDMGCIRIKADGTGPVTTYGANGVVRIGGTDYDFFAADTAGDGHQCFAGVSWSPTADLALSDPLASFAYPMQGRSFVTMTTAASAAPVITGPLAASATVSWPFRYQITATNTPTSFNATGLPSGLTINTATGVISGTPTTAAATPVTISATNGIGTGSTTLTITVGAAALIDPRLVGVWQTGGSSAAAQPNSLTTLFCFLADGTFLHVDVAAQTYQVSRYDISAPGSLWMFGGGPFTYTITGDAMTLDPGSNNGDEALTRVTSSSMVGAYGDLRPVANGDPSWVVAAFLGDGRYVHYQSGPDAQGHGQQGIEIGTYSHDGNQTLTLLTSTFDDNLDIGFHSPGDTLPKTMAVRAVATGFAGDDGGSFFATRLQSGGGTAPVVSLSGTPGTGSMTLSATASDADGTIAQVQFWYGTTLVVTDVAAPYQVVTSVAAGTYDCLAVATDNLGNSTKSGHVSVVVAGSGAPVITSTLSTSITTGMPFSYQITASNTPTSFNASGLPAGLTVDTSTGVISGYPSVAGSYPVTIAASNASGTGNAVLTLNVLVPVLPLGLGVEIQRFRYGTGSQEVWGKAYIQVLNLNQNKTVQSTVFTLPGGGTYASTQSGWWGLGHWNVLGEDEPLLTAVEAAFPTGTYSVLVTYTDATTDTATFARPALGTYPAFRTVTSPVDGTTGVSTTPTFSFDLVSGSMSVQEEHGDQVAWTQTSNVMSSWSPSGMQAGRRYEVDLMSHNQDGSSGYSWSNMTSATRVRILTAPGATVNLQNGTFNALAGDRKTVWGDAAGNRYWTTDEGFTGYRDCDPTAGLDVRTGWFGAQGLTRINSDGTYAWTRVVGGDSNPANTAAGWHALVAGGTVYLSGRFTGSVNILDAAGSPVTTDTSGLSQGGFIAAFNATTGAPVSGFGSGGILRIGNGGRGQDGALGFDGGTLYFGTRFSVILNVGGGAVSSLGGSDLAVVALDPATGAVVSGFGSSGCPGVAVIGGTGDEKPSGLVCTGGLVYFAGTSQSPTWTLLGGSRGLSATSSGGMDAFVSCLDGATGQIAAAWDPSGSGIVTVAGSGDDGGGWFAVDQGRLFFPVLTNSSAFSTQGSDHVLSAFNATTGALDTSFGNNGRVRFGGASDDGNPLNDDAGWVSADTRGILWAANANGAVSLVGATTTSVGTGNQILGLDAAGALRPGFATSGHLPAANLSVWMANILPDGAVLVQGDYTSATASLGGQMLPDTSSSRGTVSAFINGTTGLPIGGSSIAITVQPIAAPTTWAGYPVTLTVTATGTGLTYQWLRNGVAVAGATTATWTFTAQLVDDGANYMCRVGDGSGGLMGSQQATLTVVSPSVATATLTLSSPASVVQGNHATIRVTGGLMPYQVTVTGASEDVIIPMTRPYSFGTATLQCGSFVELQADQVGTVTVTVVDAQSTSATTSFAVTAAPAPIAVTPQPLTLTGDTGPVYWMALGAQTPEQSDAFMMAFEGRDWTDIRGLTYDALAGTWVDLPATPMSGSKMTSAGYIATRVPITLPTMGTPPTTYESIRLFPGWNLVNLPAVNGLASVPVSALRLMDEDGSQVPSADYATTLTRIAWWNGSGFTEEVVSGSFPTTLVTGRAYCIHNSLVTPTRRVLYLEWQDTWSVPAPQIAVARRTSAQAAPVAGGQGKNGAEATDRVYNAAVATSAPPAPPGTSETGGTSSAEPEATSGGKGCGLGSGLSFLLGAGLMLVLAGRLRRNGRP